MATEAQKQELTDKVTKLIADRFGGDWHKAFEHYDRDKQDGKINKEELGQLLKDAGIGNWLTRGAWAKGVIAALDADKDGTISGSEFEAVLNRV
jgi:Ca2+-binding EF-hand superfamily protein